MAREDVLHAAEQAVLGAAIVDAGAYDQVAELIDGAAFADPRHELIWDAVAWVRTHGDGPVSELAVADRLRETRGLDRSGGLPYLAELIGAGLVPEAAPAHAHQVQQAARRRMVEQVGLRLAQQARADGPDADLDAVVADAMARLDGEVGPQAGGIVSPDVDGYLDGIGRPRDVAATGLADLDGLLGGGLRPSRVTVIAARPGVGKSALGLQIAVNVAAQGRGALFFSLEMGIDEDLLPRFIANVTGVGLESLLTGDLTDRDWGRIAQHAERLHDLPIAWSDDPGLTPARISALIGAYKRKHPDLGVVVIDYLQLMSTGARHSNRQEEVAEMSRAIKLMAKRHGVAVVLLSQLNRAPELRSDGAPQLSDLRESGAIEQDADVVIMLHNPAGDDPLHERAGELDAFVRKNRSGQRGRVTLAAQLHLARIQSLAREHLRAA